MTIFNFNVGLLGHVDSGKTSLAKALSSISSTAAFDKDPQSQERGITLDLGFSSFSCPVPLHLSHSSFDTIQYTLVDCPGHASLIKTIIGGSQIIDLMILVIDATKGFQTQTSECLIIGEITKKKLLVVLNKVDLLSDTTALEKLVKKVKLTLDKTVFKDSPIVTASALKKEVQKLIEALQNMTFLPVRSGDKPFLFAVDHCFAMKGKGTIMTGTVLQGKAKINDDIEIPSIALTKKIKSIEVFKKPVNFIMQGDRAGICVTQFDPKAVERSLACQIGYLSKVYAAVIDFNVVKYFKGSIASKSLWHINVNYENVTGNIVLFSSVNSEDVSTQFDADKEYKYIPLLDENFEQNIKDLKLYALIEFTKPILMAPSSLLIGARLDTPIHLNFCRLAFYGNILLQTSSKNYQTTFLRSLKIYKEKYRVGSVERIVNECEIIGKNMFKKETNIEKYIGMRVQLSSGECGFIESAFGQSGKFKVRVPTGLNSSDALSKKNEQKTCPVEIVLHHKKYINHPDKKNDCKMIVK